MTIYRVEERRRWPLWLAILGLVVILAAGGVWWWRSAAAPAATDQSDEAARALREAAQGLEVFLIEYPQSGQGVEHSGALAVLDRAYNAFQRARPTLAARDPTLAEELEAEFQALRRLAEEQAPPEDLVPRAERLRDKLLSLATQP